MEKKVSVIIPVYNVEKYLGETINSVINQDIDFEKNVELILVNDGSKDDSEKVCKEYEEKYPNNIKYYYKDNSGVSDTRNFGYTKAHGKYIMFLDADDLINKKSLRLTSNFLDKHSEVNFVISRVRFFDAMEKWHYMDFRFKGNKKVVDITKDIKYCQYHSTGILIRKDALKKIKFDHNIRFGEDMKFMSQILFDNGKFGIEKNSILYYRKRQEETSAVQTQFKNKSYYLNTMKDSFRFILDEAKKRYGEIPPYFMHYIMNSLCERLLRKEPECDVHEVLNSKEYKQYIDCFMSMLKDFSDEIILNQDRLCLNHKYYLMKLLHGKKYEIKTYLDGLEAKFNDIDFEIKKGDICKFANARKDKNDIVFDVFINDYVFEPKVFINNKKANIKELKEKDYKEKYKKSLEEFYDIDFKKFYSSKLYEIRCNINEFKNMSINVCNNKAPVYVSMEFLIHNSLPRIYKKVGNKLIVFKEYEVVTKSKCVKLYTLLYKIINVIYVMKRDGIKMTLKRVKGVLNGKSSNN